MSILNTVLASGLLILASFGLFKTVEATACRHEMLSEGFWEVTKMLTPNTRQLPVDFVCGSPLIVHQTSEGLSASSIHGDYHFKLSTDIHSKELP